MTDEMKEAATKLWAELESKGIVVQSVGIADDELVAYLRYKRDVAKVPETFGEITVRAVHFGKFTL
jgi:hypothetical protein